MATLLHRIVYVVGVYTIACFVIDKTLDYTNKK